MALASSPLSSLPQELLENVAGFLEHGDVARLAECSGHICDRLSWILFRTPSELDMSMWWACVYGLPRVARCAIAWGAPPSTVMILKQGYWDPVRGNTRRSEIRGNNTILTLQLAARHGHSDVFRVLLVAGAGIPTRDTDRSPTELETQVVVQDLCTPTYDKFARLFLKSESASKLSQEILSLFFCYFIEGANTRADLVRLVLDLGGNPNHVIRFEKDPKSCLLRARALEYEADWSWIPEAKLETPLSMAVRTLCSTDVVQLLVERGAQIDGPSEIVDSVIFPTEGWRVIPIHLAVHRDTEDRIQKRLEMCMLAGANINQRIPVFRSLGIPYPSDYDGNYFYGTPFLYYFSQIYDCTKLEFSRLKALTQWFVDNGAILDPYLISPRLRPRTPPRIPPGGFAKRLPRLYSPPTAPALLIARWGMETLAGPRFLDLIKFLLSRGAVCCEQFACFLANIDYMQCDEEEERRIFAAWKELITAGVEFSRQSINSSQDWASWTLRDYVIRRFPYSGERKRPRPDKPRSFPSPIFAFTFGNIRRYDSHLLTCKTVEFLIDAGADINWHEDPDTPPVLLELCRGCEAARRDESARWHEVARWDEEARRDELAGWHEEREDFDKFFRLLVDRGADPHMTWNGKTALEIMAVNPYMAEKTE